MVIDLVCLLLGFGAAHEQRTIVEVVALALVLVVVVVVVAVGWW